MAVFFKRRLEKCTAEPDNPQKEEELVTYERLRLAREEKGFSPEELSRRTGIRQHMVELIERGEFSELPAGLYCRSVLRSYASAVGLDPNSVVESLRPYLPVPEDPLDGLARRHGHARKVEPKLPEPLTVPAAALSTEESPASVDLNLAGVAVDELLPMAELAASPPAPDAELPDVVIRTAVPVFSEVCDGFSPVEPEEPAIRQKRQLWRPLAASAIDGVLLAAIGGALVWLTAIACGTSVPVALRTAAPAVALVFGLIVALYFVLFGGVGNATLGVSLMGLDVPPPGRVVLNPRDVFGRARRSVMGDTSLLAE